MSSGETGDAEIARTYYSRAWWTGLLPALMMASVLCSAIGRSGGTASEYFAQHWLTVPLMLVSIAGLLAFATADVLRGLRRRAKIDR